MPGDITVIEQDGMVIASRDSEADLRASLGTAPVAEPEPPQTPEPTEPPAEPAETPEAEPEPEPQEAATEPERERDAQGRFKPRELDRRGESIQAKINRLRYEQGEEERRLERLRSEAQALEAKTKLEPPKPALPVTSNVPTFREFVGNYAKDHPDATLEDAYDAYQPLREAAMLEKLKDETRREQEAREMETLFRAHRERMDALKATTPDFDTVSVTADRYLADRGFARLPDVMERAILRSGKSEQIVRDLSVHPEIAYQLALEAKELTATTAAVNLMRTVLESRLVPGSTTAPPSGPVVPPRQSHANPPPKPVGHSPRAPDASLDDLSYDEFKSKFDKTIWNRR